MPGLASNLKKKLTAANTVRQPESGENVISLEGEINKAQWPARQLKMVSGVWKPQCQLAQPVSA